MYRVAAIGSRAAVEGYRLVGALVRVAEDAEAARAALSALPDDVAVVILTAEAAAALPDDGPEREWPLRAVLP